MLFPVRKSDEIISLAISTTENAIKYTSCPFYNLALKFATNFTTRIKKNHDGQCWVPYSQGYSAWALLTPRLGGFRVAWCTAPEEKLQPIRRLPPCECHAALEADKFHPWKSWIQYHPKRKSYLTVYFDTPRNVLQSRWLRQRFFLLRGRAHLHGRIVLGKKLEHRLYCPANSQRFYLLDSEKQIFVA